MLRAGPFSDERIVGLLNARFVPFYFDLAVGSPAGDAEAKEFCVAIKEELGGSSVPTPPILIITVEGELVAEISNYADEETVLRKLRLVLAENGDLAAPSEEEANWPVIQKARLRVDLGDHAGARRLLEGQDEPSAHLLLARLARHERNWTEHARELAKLDGKSHEHEVRMEQALWAWNEERYADIVDLLAQFPTSSGRYSEARYYEGLAYYHSEETELARETWKQLVSEIGEDRWSYRADWAWSQSHPKERAHKSSTSTRPKTLLERHGYMGRTNPDLSGPRP